MIAFRAAAAALRIPARRAAPRLRWAGASNREAIDRPDHLDRADRPDRADRADRADRGGISRDQTP